jgi:hypothetical protein
MSAIGLILLAASTVAFFVGLIGLIKPMARIGVPTRKRAAIVFLASFILSGVGSSLLPDPDDQAVAEGWTSAAEQRAAQALEIQTKVDYDAYRARQDEERRIAEVESARKAQEAREKADAARAAAIEEQRRANLVAEFSGEGWTGKIVQGEGFTVTGRPALPEGTEMMLFVWNPLGDLAQEKMTLTDDAFTATVFGTTDKWYSGDYRVWITAAAPALQPESVRESMGARGENLTGPCAREEGIFGKTYRCEETVPIVSNGPYAISPEATQAEIRRIAEETAKAEEEEAACNANAQCLFDKRRIEAAVACRPAIERLLTYDYEWMDGFGTGKFLFSHGGFKADDKGIFRFLGDALKAQNGFGAWANMIYSCEYDIEKQEFTTVEVEPGKI